MRSGAMYRAVPMSSCSRGPRAARAMPKSVSLAVPCWSTMTFAGFTSQWMTPASCAASSAAAICATRRGSAVAKVARAQRSAVSHDVTQRAPTYELHDHESVGAVAALVEDRDDVRMYHGRRAPRLIREALAERLVGTGTQDLDRHIAVEALVASLPDLARAAFVDAFVQAVPAGEEPALRGVLPALGAFFRWHVFRWRQGSGQRHQGRERGFVHVVVPRDRELLAEQLADPERR